MRALFASKKLPLKGYKANLNEIKLIDSLSDDDLIKLNNLLRWNCFVVDRHGRRFGNAAWAGKRAEPQVVPDRRILLMNERFNLSDKHVLEFGCFEGIHTIALSMCAKKVTAIDARIENVVKTIIRCAFFGYSPTVFACDVETEMESLASIKADVACHIGVLYHLQEPVRHLQKLAKLVTAGVLLDTHYATDEEAQKNYWVDGSLFQYKRYREVNTSVFAGVYDHAKWLRLTDIVQILSASGFKQVEIVETRKERNGARALLLAERN
jgi:2-polyprenyl-3-methyl-5-hydroxy-6-metoxy-1,4-benzoquinol methylase